MPFEIKIDIKVVKKRVDQHLRRLFSTKSEREGLLKAKREYRIKRNK